MSVAPTNEDRDRLDRYEAIISPGPAMSFLGNSEVRWLIDQLRTAWAALGWYEAAGQRQEKADKTLAYDRAKLIQCLIYHNRTDQECVCGWGQGPRELGRSFSEHVTHIYEQMLTE